jgi:hypothetical protein
MVNAKAGNFTTNTVTGNQAITGLGFTPKAVIFFGLKISAARESGGFFGCATGSANRWCSSYDTDDFGDVVAAKFSGTRCLQEIDPTGVLYMDADFVSLDADGFTVNITTAINPGVPIYYLALGGAEMSAQAGTFNSNTATGNQSKTGVGFQPNGVIFGIGPKNTTDAAVTTFMELGIGWGISSTKRDATTFMTDDAVTTDSQSILRATECILNITIALAIDEAADFVSNDTDGFTINWTTKSVTAIKIGYLALGGALQLARGTFTSPAATGNVAYKGTGFNPVAELFISRGKVAATTAVADSKQSIGVATSATARASTAFSDQDNVDSSSNPDGAVSTTKAITHIGNTTTVTAAADLVSQNADGFTLNWTTADATARDHAYLAFGQILVGSYSQPFHPGAGVLNMARFHQTPMDQTIPAAEQITPDKWTPHTEIPIFETTKVVGY